MINNDTNERTSEEDSKNVERIEEPIGEQGTKSCPIEIISSQESVEVQNENPNSNDGRVRRPNNEARRFSVFGNQSTFLEESNIDSTRLVESEEDFFKDKVEGKDIGVKKKKKKRKRKFSMWNVAQGYERRRRRKKKKKKVAEQYIPQNSVLPTRKKRKKKKTLIRKIPQFSSMIQDKDENNVFPASSLYKSKSLRRKKKKKVKQVNKKDSPKPSLQVIRNSVKKKLTENELLAKFMHVSEKEGEDFRKREEEKFCNEFFKDLKLPFPKVNGNNEPGINISIEEMEDKKLLPEFDVNEILVGPELDVNNKIPNIFEEKESDSSFNQDGILPIKDEDLNEFKLSVDQETKESIEKNFPNVPIFRKIHPQSTFQMVQTANKVLVKRGGGSSSSLSSSTVTGIPKNENILPVLIDNFGYKRVNAGRGGRKYKSGFKFDEVFKILTKDWVQLAEMSLISTQKVLSFVPSEGYAFVARISEDFSYDDAVQDVMGSWHPHRFKQKEFDINEESGCCVVKRRYYNNNSFTPLSKVVYNLVGPKINRILVVYYTEKEIPKPFVVKCHGNSKNPNIPFHPSSRRLRKRMEIDLKMEKPSEVYNNVLSEDIEVQPDGKIDPSLIPNPTLAKNIRNKNLKERKKLDNERKGVKKIEGTMYNLINFSKEPPKQRIGHFPKYDGKNGIGYHISHFENTRTGVFCTNSRGSSGDGSDFKFKGKDFDLYVRAYKDVHLKGNPVRIFGAEFCSGHDEPIVVDHFSHLRQVVKLGEKFGFIYDFHIPFFVMDGEKSLRNGARKSVKIWSSRAEEKPKIIWEGIHYQKMLKRRLKKNKADTIAENNRFFSDCSISLESKSSIFQFGRFYAEYNIKKYGHTWGESNMSYFKKQIYPELDSLLDFELLEEGVEVNTRNAAWIESCNNMIDSLTGCTDANKTDMLDCVVAIMKKIKNQMKEKRNAIMGIGPRELKDVYLRFRIPFDNDRPPSETERLIRIAEAKIAMLGRRLLRADIRNNKTRMKEMKRQMYERILENEIFDRCKKIQPIAVSATIVKAARLHSENPDAVKELSKDLFSVESSQNENNISGVKKHAYLVNLFLGSKGPNASCDCKNTHILRVIIKLGLWWILGTLEIQTEELMKKGRKQYGGRKKNQNKTKKKKLPSVNSDEESFSQFTIQEAEKERRERVGPERKSVQKTHLQLQQDLCIDDEETPSPIDDDDDDGWVSNEEQRFQREKRRRESIFDVESEEQIQMQPKKKKRKLIVVLKKKKENVPPPAEIEGNSKKVDCCQVCNLPFTIDSPPINCEKCQRRVHSIKLPGVNLCFVFRLCAYCLERRDLKESNVERKREDNEENCQVCNQTFSEDCRPVICSGCKRKVHISRPKGKHGFSVSKRCYVLGLCRFCLDGKKARGKKGGRR